MRKRSYWDDCAEAMELTIEGNQLIVTEIVTCLRDEWRAAMRWIAEIVRRTPSPGRSRPV